MKLLISIYFVILLNIELAEAPIQPVLSLTKALADENRLRVLAVLRRKRELCACHLTELLQLAAPTVSRHMGLLISAGLVKSQKKGRWVYYRLGEAYAGPLGQWLENCFLSTPQTKNDQAVLERLLRCALTEVGRRQRRRVKSLSRSW